MQYSKALMLNMAAALVCCCSYIFSPLHSADAAPQADTVDMIIASIDGEPVTMTDLRSFASNQGATLPSDMRSPEAKKFLKDLVVEQLLNKAAKDANITVSDDDVQAYIAEVRKQNGLGDTEFRELLKGRGMPYEDYVVQIRSDILRARVVGQKTREKIQVLDEDVDRYLKEQPELLPQEGTFRLERIFVPKEGRSEEELRRAAERIRSEAIAGKALKDVAGEAYQDLGFVKPTELRPEIQRVVSKLEPGKIGPLIPSKDGYTMFMVSTASQASDPRFRQEVRTMLYQKKLKEVIDQYLNEELPKKYNVEIKI